MAYATITTEIATDAVHRAFVGADGVAEPTDRVSNDHCLSCRRPWTRRPEGESDDTRRWFHYKCRDVWFCPSCVRDMTRDMNKEDRAMVHRGITQDDWYLEMWWCFLNARRNEQWPVAVAFQDTKRRPKRRRADLSEDPSDPSEDPSDAIELGD